MAAENHKRKFAHTIDCTGKRFRNVIAIRPLRHDRQGTIWLCRCDCGNTVEAHGFRLRNGRGVCCTKRRYSSHGGAHSRLYGIWKGIVQRCANPHYHAYSYYGGRGISICDRWRIFENFLADMGRPPPGLEIERINNDGGYEKLNCRWATRAEQMRNTRRNRFITYNNETMCVRDWAARIGIVPHLLKWRLEHWSVERALTTPKLN